jgi:putative N6-adenine-specific DNA methylase
LILKFGEIMASFEYTVPCLFGLEAILKREITDLGYEISSVDDGRVSFYGDVGAIARANFG